MIVALTRLTSGNTQGLDGRELQLINKFNLLINVFCAKTLDEQVVIDPAPVEIATS